MKIFGYSIQKAASNKATAALAPEWTSGFSWLSGQDFGAMVKAYKSWIYVCANKNASTVSKQTLNLYASKPTKSSKILCPYKAINRKKTAFLDSLASIKNLPAVRKSNEIIEVVEHPFLSILARPNAFMSGTDLIEMTSLYQELTGNAYWYIVEDETFGIPMEIWLLPSQYIKIVPGKDQVVAGYVYRQGTKEIPFEATEVLHFKYPNPQDYFYGISPLLAVADSYNTNENILRFTNALFTNMARPEGVLQTEQNLTEEDFTSLKERWNAAYGGPSKANKTAVLTKGLKYTPITMSPRELDFRESRQVVREEICNAFGQSLGLYSDKANRANAEQAYASFLRDAIQPRLRRIEDTINLNLLPRFDSNIFVVFDNPVPEDKEFRLKERESNLKNGYSSINEERKIDGREDVTWGDLPLLQQNIVPFGSAPISPADSNSSSSAGLTEEDESKFVVRQLIQRFKHGKL